MDLADQPETRGGLTQDAAHLMLRQLALAASRNVPLPDVLEALADDVGDMRFSAAAQRLAGQLRSGASLEDAVEAEQASFPPRIRGMVAAGLSAKNLAGVVGGFAELEITRRQIMATVRSALAYPVLLVALLIPVLMLFALYVVPIFENLFREFGLRLPQVTLTAFHTARVAPFALGALLVLPAATAMMMAALGRHWLMHRLRGAVPFFGPLWVYAAQHEFAAVLSMLISTKLPLPEAVDAASRALADRGVARASAHLRNAVQQGTPLGQALERSIHFDRAMGPMVNWGEQHDVLEEALAITASMMRTRLEDYAAMLRRVVPAVSLIIIATFVVGIALVGFLLPLLNLVSGLSGGGGGGSYFSPF